MDEATESLVADPDAVLFRRGKELDQHLSLFTVPLFFFQGEVTAENLKEVGTAVTFRCGRGKFLLTAGHCVDAVDKYDACAVVIDRKPHKFTPTFATRNRGEEDFGYVEIAATDAGYFESKQKVYLSVNRIAPLTRKEIEEANDWMVVSGFPDKYKEAVPLSSTGEWGHKTRQLHAVTGIAGIGGAPESTLPPPTAGLEAIDLWLPERGNIDTTSGTYREIDVPAFSGISGGGYWKAGVRPDPETWDVGQMRLVGIHIWSTYAPEDRFTRAVLIRHHLELIAADHPDAEEEIREKWPALLP